MEQIDGSTVVQILLGHESELVRTATQNAILQVQNQQLQIALAEATSPNLAQLDNPYEGGGPENPDAIPEG